MSAATKKKGSISGSSSNSSEKGDAQGSGSNKDTKAAKKKKKRVVNEAQSQVLSDLSLRSYMDTLLSNNIADSEFKNEYNKKIAPEELNKYYERFKTDLERSYGNPELIKDFYETKGWMEGEEWRHECVQFKLMKYREEITQTKSTFDPNKYDEEEEEDD